MPTHSAKKQSMTGYAVTEQEISSRKFRLHLKSVNNRFFDLKWRAPKSWISQEIPFKNSLKKKFQRGSFEFWIEEVRDQSQKSEQNSQDYFKRLNETIQSTKGISKLAIPSFVQALILSRQPELWAKCKDDSLDANQLKPALDSLMQDFESVRVLEGNTLCEHLLEVSNSLKTRLSGIEKRIPELRSDFENDMKAKLKALFEQFSVGESESNRISSEIAVQIDKRDCSEEVQRISMHIDAFQKAIEQNESNLGKRLDFIAQELNREWNTLGSKLRVQEIFQEVLEAKLDIEKIREQCLNLA